MKVVCGLGNPGSDYDATRHNVGWWAVDRLAVDWRLGPFRREGAALVASGDVGAMAVWLLKPLTYMNRSGAAVVPLRRVQGFDVTRDLLAIVDDAALDVGRIRFRPHGTAGGHNGLKSLEAVLGTQQYARLRIGVGRPPPGADLAEWVLSPVPAEDEACILELLPIVVDGVRTWVEEGTAAAMNRYNR